MTEAFSSFQRIQPMGGIGGTHPVTTFDEGHLGWKVITLQNFNNVLLRTETHVIGSSVITAAQQPQSSHPLLTSLKSVWRSEHVAVAAMFFVWQIASETGQSVNN